MICDIGCTRMLVISWLFHELASYLYPRLACLMKPSLSVSSDGISSIIWGLHLRQAFQNIRSSCPCFLIHSPLLWEPSIDNAVIIIETVQMMNGRLTFHLNLVRAWDQWWLLESWWATYFCIYHPSLGRNSNNQTMAWTDIFSNVWNRLRLPTRFTRDLLIGIAVGITFSLSSTSLALLAQGWRRRRAVQRIPPRPIQLRSDEVVPGVIGLIGMSLW